MPIDAIHLCCPGPSLAAVARDALAGAFVVGVNRAVETVRCDAWVAIDRQAFELFTPLGDPLRVSMASMPVNLARHAPAKREEAARARWMAINHCCWPPPPKHVASYYNLSGVAGLVYAVSLASHVGVRLVTISGCDLAGHGDCVGDTCEAGRDDARWSREATSLAWAVSVARERGVGVRFDPMPARLRAIFDAERATTCQEAAA